MYGTTVWNSPNPSRATLIVGIPLKVAAAASPILTQRDFYARAVAVENAEPVLVEDSFAPAPAWSRSELVLLEPTPVAQGGDLLQTRSIADGAGVTVETSFYWPPTPRTPLAGYTAPLVRWVETRITGLTSTPIVLHGEESQTYRPGHHNFTENFIFAPALEPGMAPALLAELDTRGIHLIRVTTGFAGSTVAYYDACGVGHVCACTASFRRGDCNGDGNVAGSVTDAVVLLGYLFLGGEPPPCLAACDADGDGRVVGGVTDAVYLLSFGFLGGPAPPAPFPDCGPGGVGDRALGCARPGPVCGR